MEAGVGGKIVRSHKGQKDTVITVQDYSNMVIEKDKVKEHN